MMRILKTLLTSGAACFLANGAAAETLPVAGIYPAGVDAPSQVRGIAIDRFGGQAGEELAFAIEDRLRGAVIEGEPWFDITFNQPGGQPVYIFEGDPGSDREILVERTGPDAVLRGLANVEVTDNPDGTREVERCTERDDRNKCTAKVIELVECFLIEVSLRPDLRLVSREGRSLYADRDLRTASQRYCADDTTLPSVDAMVAGLIESYANDVRRDLAPVYLAEGVRLLENRKGLSKADNAAFRAALRLTKNDAYGACLAFEQLEADNPEHTSVLFNIGLCHESQGDLAGAEEYYQRTLAIQPGTGYARTGMSRLGERRRAERQLALHYGEGYEE